MVLAPIFTGLTVNAMLRFKLFCLFLETAVRGTTTPLNLRYDLKLRVTILLSVYRYRAAPGAQSAP